VTHGKTLRSVRPGDIPTMSLTSPGRVNAMRLEATVPDNRGEAVIQLAEELGLSRSQLIDEALALFLRAVIEIRRGRRLVTLDPTSGQAAAEIATPTLTALEWAAQPRKLTLTPTALAKVKAEIDAPRAPSPRLVSAAKRRR
jgi:hypothetical protein